MRNYFILASLFISVLTLTGCSSPEVLKEGAVTGKVSVNGKTLTGGRISFYGSITENGKKEDYNRTFDIDATGNIMVTPQTKLAFGDYRVSISNSHLKGLTKKQIQAKDAPANIKDVQHMPIPAKFEKPESSGLTFKVDKESGNVADFDLK